MTLDAPPAPLHVTTVLTPAETLLGIYTGPHTVPPPPPTQHAKVHLSVEQQSSVRGICETRMWRVNLRNSYTQFPLEFVLQHFKEVGVALPADVSASASGKPSVAAAPDADNPDLVNMPATFYYEGIETSW